MLGKLALGSLGVAVVMTILLVIAQISNDRVDSWLTRAKDAGNPEQAAEFLGEYNDALYARNKVDGKYYTVFKYPATKMETYIDVIGGLEQRAADLAEQRATDESYQMGLINLEEDLDDINARSWSVWFAGGGYVLMILCIVTWISGLTLGFIKILRDS